MYNNHRDRLRNEGSQTRPLQANRIISLRPASQIVPVSEIFDRYYYENGSKNVYDVPFTRESRV